jgi:hypothetical protein
MAALFINQSHKYQTADLFPNDNTGASAATAIRLADGLLETEHGRGTACRNRGRVP